MADFWSFARKAKEIYSWYSFAAGGLALAVVGGGWLVAHSIPWPLAAMAAYCTVVAALFVALVPTLHRGLPALLSRFQSPTIQYGGIELRIFCTRFPTYLQTKNLIETQQ